MDWSIFPMWVWHLVKDPITPAFLAAMTAILINGQIRSRRSERRGCRTLADLRDALGGLRNATREKRHAWVFDGGLASAFAAAGLPREGREMVATATSLTNGDAALHRTEVARLLEPHAVARKLLSPASAQTGTILVGIGTIGTFAGIVLGLSGVRDGLAGGSNTAFLTGIAQLLEGAAVAFLTSLYGLSAKLVCGVTHRRSLARVTAAAAELRTAAFETFQTADEAEYLRRELRMARDAAEQTLKLLRDTLPELSKTSASRAERAHRDAAALKSAVEALGRGDGTGVVHGLLRRA